jgi:PPOX class probable F420-dependent enzyme
MPADLSQYADLLKDKKAFAHLATLMPDGTPQSTPVWFDYVNGAIRVMKQGSPVALSILDPDNPYRYLQVRGKVRKVTEDGAVAHIDSLAKKYIGQDKYPWSKPSDVRVIYEIEPERIQGMG